jgi:predicted metal-binding protein
LSKYIELALSLGAASATQVTPDDIVFDGRTILKCMFGCSSWGKGCTCPSRSNALKPWEYEPLLRKYRNVIIIGSPDKKVSQDTSFALERQAFLDGDVLAFSMSDCAICAKCAGYNGEPCVNPKKARPSFHSVGIDVFATVRKLGLPIEVLQNKEDIGINWYSAVWLN